MVKSQYKYPIYKCGRRNNRQMSKKTGLYAMALIVHPRLNRAHPTCIKYFKRVNHVKHVKHIMSSFLAVGKPKLLISNTNIAHSNPSESILKIKYQNLDISIPKEKPSCASLISSCSHH